MAEEHSEPRLEDKLVWMIARVNHRLEQSLARRLKSRGLPIEQYWIMQALCEKGPTSISHLAETAHAGRPNTTKIVDRMVSAGLVFRAADPHDRRRINIVATDEGRFLYQETAEYGSEVEQNLQDKLEQDDLNTLKSLLQSIA